MRALRRAGFNPPWPTEVGPTARHSCRLWALYHVKRHGFKCRIACNTALTSMCNKDTPKHETCVPCVGKGFNPPWPTEVGPTTRHSCRLWALFHVKRHGFKCRIACNTALTSMCNKDTPKHETCVPCVGRVSTRHGRLKSALRHAILVGCGRCFTLTYQTRSKMPAAPCPMPMHIVTIPYLPWVRCRPWITVAARIAPVAPSG